MFNQSRSYIIRLLFVLAFLVILFQLFHLQVLSSEYKDLADRNALQRKTVYPSRGIIFDRKGRPLVKNVMMHDLMVTPSEMKRVDTNFLCQLLEIDTAEFRKRILDAIVKNGPSRPSSFEDLLTPEKYARLEENMWRFGSGFFLQDRPVRTYPFDAGAHFMGYIGKVDSAIIARSDGFYEPNDFVGRSGLEASYEKILMGQRGEQWLVKDTRGRIQGSYANGSRDEPAIAGRGLNTFVDGELQQLAEKLLKNKLGSIVALDPKTGGILAMASGPVFSPNDLTGYNFKKSYSKYVLDVSRPLLNRAIKGQYPAGSTYKPVGALIALEEGVITPQTGIGCRGAYYGCARPVKCTEKWSGHSGNLRQSIAYSCNSFFSLAYQATVNNPRFGGVRRGGYMKWKEYVNAFGLGQRLGVDLPSEDRGNIPDTSFYNRKYNNSWNSCTNVSLGIGQGEMLATPLQIANTMAIIANRGYYYTPHFVKSIEGEEEGDTALNKYRTQHKIPVHISDTVYNIVIQGMHDVTTIGTAAPIPRIPGVEICAKTGTAENFHRGKQQKDHSVFACYAPMEDPKIAVAVIVENGGFGATWAGPMAYLMVEQYLKDSLRAGRQEEAKRIAEANLLPSWLPEDQYREDSARAQYYFKLTKDSNYIRKYVGKARPAPPAAPKKDSVPPARRPVERNVWLRPEDLVEPPRSLTLRKPYYNTTA